jgi:hypothetical protein
MLKNYFGKEVVMPIRVFGARNPSEIVTSERFLGKPRNDSKVTELFSESPMA